MFRELKRITFYLLPSDFEAHWKKYLIAVFTCWHLTWKSNTCGHLAPCCSLLQLLLKSLGGLCTQNIQAGAWCSTEEHLKLSLNCHDLLLCNHSMVAQVPWWSYRWELSLCTCLLFSFFFFFLVKHTIKVFARKDRILFVNSFHVQLITNCWELKL